MKDNYVPFKNMDDPTDPIHDRLEIIINPYTPTSLDIFVDEYKSCDGEIEHFKEFYSGAIFQCPDCEHWQSTVHDSSLDDHIEELTQLCHCCGYMGEYQS